MAQKDKVKELVGRGLNSYHTKSLQQIDRIEKKNKEQNHKISILTNELDNDYLTKTEEGSVVSLEHSKEGMVYLDELQGNTLVNYCTDGSKEMTLNGDIDVEGTFVTTTEGVDNGKVDVMCEGNTLVNIFSTNNYGHTTHAEIKNNITYNMTKNSIEVSFNNDCIGSEYMVLLIGDANTKHISMLKPNQKYTLCFDVEQNYDWTLDINCKKGNSADPLFIANRVKIKNGRNKITMTTLATLPTLTDQRMYLDVTDKTQRLAGRYLKISNLVLVENEEDNIVPYFEGMKSVGQDDENGHKIEILSKNKNLFNPEEVYESGYSYGVPFVNSVKCQEEDGVFTRMTSVNNWNTGIGFHIKTEKNKDYTLSVGEYFNDGVNMELRCVGVYKSEYPFKANNNIQLYVNRIAAKDLDSNNNSLTYNSKDYDYILFYIGGKWNANANGVKTFRISKIEVNQSSTKPTNYTKQNFNKKEILLNEPLRSVPNGAKDKFVKIGGKSYIERNCGYAFLDENRVWRMNENATKPIFETSISDIITITQDITGNKLICDKLQSNAIYSSNENNGVCFVNGSVCRIRVEGLTTLEEYTNWITSNPITIIFSLATPIYEPLEIEPTLNTYNDTTHISNNSIIPCNMKIKNSGYNTIIKPSTQYTVALDTNKYGTIGMNLGGAKVTTTNNVATITTPATLTDDSLRLYGKGIKGSKVRLLEGDKTNWIPSHFEGMKSSFEDKFDDTDNTYKMEILSNNKNLINIKDYNKNTWGINISYSQGEIVLNGTLTGKDNGLSDYYLVGNWDTAEDNLNLKPNTSYIFSGNIPNGVEVYIIHKAKVLCGIHSGNKIATWTNGSIRDVNALMVRVREGHNFSNTRINIQLEEGSTSTTFVNNIYNKIQFSSIEPLRKWDRFVFKDGQLMIERRTLKKALTKDMPWSLNTTVVDKNSTQFVCRILPTWGCSPSNEEILCDKKPTKNINSGSNSIWVYAKTTLVLQMRYDTIKTIEDLKVWLDSERPSVQLPLTEPTYEEIPFELQKIILEGHENGTLFFDTNIPPTSTVTYEGETPIVKATKLNKTEVLNNTNDINDNIVPYLMDMDYRVVCLQLQSENINDGVSMARLFGGTYEMLQRDILSKRYSVEEYKYRLDAYLSVNKITEKEYEELGEMLNE